MFERLKHKVERKKNSLKQLEAYLKERERIARTSQLIELGKLVVKAGLDELENNVLLGLLLEIKERAVDEKTVQSWTQLGAAAFAKENRGKTPVIVKFATKPAQEVRYKIQDLGLKWNALRGEWQGDVKVPVLRHILKNKESQIFNPFLPFLKNYTVWQRLIKK